jgi:hypothetical protein
MWSFEMKGKGRTISAAFWAGFLLTCVAAGAEAQEKPIWSDIECGQSKLVAPTGLKCRATQEYSGGSRLASGSGPNGISRDWAAFGTVNGNRFYYFGKEAISARSSVFPYVLVDAIRSLSPQGRNATGFSSPEQMDRADYLRFTSAAGAACIAVRKEGPARKLGFEWIVIATECAQSGKSMSGEELRTFVAGADFHI